MAVVADVRVRQECTAIADGRGHPTALGAWINRNTLTKRAIVADGERRCLATIFEILRGMTDRGEWKKTERYSQWSFAQSQPHARSDSHPAPRETSFPTMQ